MKIQDLNRLEIKNNEEIKSNFLSIDLKNLSSNCQIYKGDFYIDSFNYFPVTNNNFSFSSLFSWKEKSEYNYFFTKKFYSNLEKNKNNLKSFNDVVVIGSSPGDNYFRNLITFIPRLFFIPGRKINIAIHRNSSNKLRKFIEDILKSRSIEINRTIYLDDGFYFFKNSLMPQFMTKKASAIILNKIFKRNKKNLNRVYLTRKNAKYRKIINESDLIDKLRLKNFKIVDPETLSIDKQIDVFSSAEIIVSPTGSALANVVFCNKGTKIFEIKPKYQYQHEKAFNLRYYKLCKILDFKYYSLEADPIQIDEVDDNTEKYVDKNILNKSNYYKNLLVKTEDFIKFISQI